MTIDAGNTQTGMGLFAGEELAHHWRVATDADRTGDEHALLVSQLLALKGLDAAGAVTGVAICSTVPRVQAALREMVQAWFPVPSVVIEPGVRTGMAIAYDNPRDVGADRIANAVAAVALHGAPVMVVDFGTATTFDVVSDHGEYLGGAIAPGIEISLDALFTRASMLRRVELVAPRHVVGRSTVESLQSGAVYGYAALAEGMCRRIHEELGSCPVVGTGGLGALMVPWVPSITDHQPWLTLQGLRLVFGRNAGGEAGGSG